MTLNQPENNEDRISSGPTFKGKADMQNISKLSEQYPPTMGQLARLILQHQSTGEPIFVSINGKGSLPVTDAQSIQQLFEVVDQLETIEKVRASIKEIDAGGNTYSLDEVMQQLKAKHDVSV